MGLFTQDCRGCHNPLLADFNTERINSWMAHGVAIAQDGAVVEGYYDGYGVLVTLDDDELRCVGNNFTDDGHFAGTGPTVWHHACWLIAGSPREWQGESESSDDQGHFFDEGTYDIPRPETADDVQRATQYAQDARQAAEAENRW